MEEKSTIRIQSIDLLRGLVMIIMALDHCREFMHHDVMIGQRPLDFTTTYPLLFLTRWITHFCAPVFVFLSGTSIFLYARGHSKKEVGFFLVTRGLWLMLIEIVLIHPLWDFNITVIYLQVIWAIGLSMVFLSLLQFLPYHALIALGLIIVFGHNLLDGIVVESPFWKSVLWSIMHVRHEYPINNDLLLIIDYPFLPWLGIMILGYVAGRLYGSDFQPVLRRKILRIAGLTCIALFIGIRAVNVYGDMHQWTTQKTMIFTILDFVKASKYPPSLLFTLMTLGPSLILLSYMERVSTSIARKVIVFGKVPFFYYVLHVFLIHSIAVLSFRLSGHTWNEMDFTNFRLGSLPYGSGHPLWFVFIAWFAVIIILYFPCKWYSDYKATHRGWWLSYL